jgi:hypothetical protein
MLFGGIDQSLRGCGLIRLSFGEMTSNFIVGYFFR